MLSRKTSGLFFTVMPTDAQHSHLPCVSLFRCQNFKEGNSTDLDRLLYMAPLTVTTRGTLVRSDSQNKQTNSNTKTLDVPTLWSGGNNFRGWIVQTVHEDLPFQQVYWQGTRSEPVAWELGVEKPLHVFVFFKIWCPWTYLKAERHRRQK